MLLITSRRFRSECWHLVHFVLCFVGYKLQNINYMKANENSFIVYYVYSIRNITNIYNVFDVYNG